MLCEKCNYDIQIGDFPFCKGNQLDHQRGIISNMSRVFPFEARHVTPDGKPITIESMQHLRKIEREYGVALSVFNNNDSNSVDPLRDVPRYRGGDEDFRRDHGYR